MGSSVKLKGRGIRISTDNYNIPYTVKLINVLIIKYSLQCNLLISKNKTTIYIYRSSLGCLIKIMQSVLTSNTSNTIKERTSYFINLLDQMEDNNSVAHTMNITAIRFSFDNVKSKGGLNSFKRLQCRTLSTSSISTPNKAEAKLNPEFVTGFTYFFIFF